MISNILLCFNSVFLVCIACTPINKMESIGTPVKSETDDSVSLIKLQTFVDSIRDALQLSEDIMQIRFKCNRIGDKVNYLGFYGLPLSQIPIQIQPFKSLIRLDILTAKLMSIGDLKLDSLKYLGLFKNELTKFPDDMESKFPRLEVLNLSHNLLVDTIYLDELPKCLKELNVVGNIDVLISVTSNEKIKELSLQNVIYDKGTQVDVTLLSYKEINFIKVKNLKSGE